MSRFEKFNGYELTVLDLAFSYFIDTVRKDFRVIANRPELYKHLRLMHGEILLEKRGPAEL